MIFKPGRGVSLVPNCLHQRQIDNHNNNDAGAENLKIAVSRFPDKEFVVYIIIDKNDGELWRKIQKINEKIVCSITIESENNGAQELYSMRQHSKCPIPWRFDYNTTFLPKT